VDVIDFLLCLYYISFICIVVSVKHVEQAEVVSYMVTMVWMLIVA